MPVPQMDAAIADLVRKQSSMLYFTLPELQPDVQEKVEAKPAPRIPRNKVDIMKEL